MALLKSNRTATTEDTRTVQTVRDKRFSAIPLLIFTEVCMDYIGAIKVIAESYRNQLTDEGKQPHTHTLNKICSDLYGARSYNDFKNNIEKNPRAIEQYSAVLTQRKKTLLNGPSEVDVDTIRKDAEKAGYRAEAKVLLDLAVPPRVWIENTDLQRQSKYEVVSSQGDIFWLRWGIHFLGLHTNRTFSGTGIILSTIYEQPDRPFEHKDVFKKNVMPFINECLTIRPDYPIVIPGTLFGNPENEYWKTAEETLLEDERWIPVRVSEAEPGFCINADTLDETIRPVSEWRKKELTAFHNGKTARS